ncbi:ribosomal protein S18-alanine N-acetyltransferase [Schleiferilactobacillus perolens]|jgi:ribosomal-protein-alanine N-acetyltransferase|uniref:Acetyltransferase n=1 Tax=Schleiferilactobacillus perolens DSM 12744 TaxID=1423792 RepID=A0A0R1MKW0_9LACO|nr:ribosomal protein S18-alanine N-acetyltransferase [Schleiferilactobacillus perolens]KRL08492.1 acetyltransferase [Schleiferilactobacillus perolens DSM 12744]MCI1891267.1 ribosomal protein S18-alanine N-acetyltransferase [Schleiferilactobacillus harbinensis]MCI1912705.1 ribosomal protein S18-alanine N-acetyltransferase [Schleiferilactobacillus harbinensis]
MFKKFKEWFSGSEEQPAILQYPETPVTIKGVSYVLKKAAEEDIPAMLAVERRIYQGQQPWDARAFHSELRRRDKALYLNVFHDQDLVAYIGSWFTPDEAHVTNLAVDPDWQSRGLGRFLMQLMIHRAAVYGASKMTLEVRVDNAPAISLYHSLGFQNGAIKPNYYLADHMDARNMILPIDPQEKEE